MKISKQKELEALLEIAENRIKVLEQTLEFERERYRVNVEYLEEEYAARIVKNTELPKVPKSKLKKIPEGYEKLFTKTAHDGRGRG